MCSVVDVAVRRRGLYVCGLLLLLLFYLRGCLQIMTKHWLTSSFCMGRWGEGGGFDDPGLCTMYNTFCSSIHGLLNTQSLCLFKPSLQWVINCVQSIQTTSVAASLALEFSKDIQMFHSSVCILTACITSNSWSVLSKTH